MGYKDISLVIGAEENDINCKDIAYKYSKVDNCTHEYNAVIKYWEDLTNKLVVKTPNDSINIMLNGWLYITC